MVFTIDEAKRYYHSKQDFDDIKVNLEKYVLQRYPELEQDQLISKDKQLDKNGQRVKSTNANKREGEYIRRTGKLSKKQQTANRIKDIFLMADNIADYTNRLREENIESYVRGKTMGFVVDGKKHRIHTLGITEEFDDMLLRFQADNEQVQETQKQTTQEQQPHTTKSTEENQTSDYDAMVKKRMEQMKAKFADADNEQSRSNDNSKGRSR